MATTDHIPQVAASAHIALRDAMSSSPEVVAEQIAPVTAFYSQFFEQVDIEARTQETLGTSTARRRSST